MRRSRTAFPSGTPSTVVASGAALSSRRYQVRRPVRVAVLARDPLAGQVLLPNTPGRLVAMHPPENMDAGAGTAYPCATRGRPLLRRGQQSPVADLVDRRVVLFGPRCPCSATVRAWPVPWPPPSPRAITSRHSAGTMPSTDAAPMPGGAAQVSWRPCWSRSPGPASWSRRGSQAAANRAGRARPNRRTMTSDTSAVPDAYTAVQTLCARICRRQCALAVGAHRRAHLW